MEYRAEAVNPHPDYDFIEILADVAVITLSENITFSDTVQAIELPVTGDDALQVCVITTKHNSFRTGGERRKNYVSHNTSFSHHQF